MQHRDKCARVRERRDGADPKVDAVWAGDILRRAAGWLADLDRPLDVVLVDPPYPLTRQWLADDPEQAPLQRVLFAPVAGALAADGIVVLRTPADLPGPERLGTLQRRRHRIYGTTALNYYQHARDDQAEP